MGRPPSNGGPTFRFMSNEVTEMENILHDHNYVMPSKEVLVALAEKFSENPDRKGNFIVQMKQVWNWFQNRRYAVRANKSKTPVNVTPVSRDEPTQVKSTPPPIATPTPTPTPAPAAAPAAAPPPAPAAAPPPISAPTPTAAAMITPPASTAGRATSENSSMEFEAKSARDGAWYDVGQFLSHKHLDTADPEVLVRFAGFGPDEDEWINVRKNIRQRSLPCEASECVAVLPGDLILCFQEGKDQALYFDAHVLDAQRRRHDVRGCRCRFLVRYDHDHSEEIVPLRKVCRRPETDYRLQQLQAANDAATADQQKTITNPPGILLNAKASLTPKTKVPEMKTAHPPTTANIGTPAIGSGTYTSNPNVPATGTVNAGSSGAAR